MIRISQIVRLATIQRTLLRHGFDEIVFSIAFMKPFKFILRLLPWNWFRAEYESRGVRIRGVLEELGPIFVKFGQILSTRRDFIPDDVAEELSRLQDDVPPFAGEEARKLIEKAYGCEVSEIFLDFDENPIASASIAQVHGATLRDGTQVIVKVVRPDIEPTITQDVSLMNLMASLLERYWEPAARLKFSLVVAEVEKTIFDELDMFREGANASQLSRNFGNSAKLCVPKVFWDYTCDNILVTEKVVGLNISDRDALIKAGVDLKALAVTGVDILFTQIFRDHFFHADIHPGNIFIIPQDGSNPDRYAVVDFGIMGSLSEFDQHYLAENCSAFLNRDYRRVAELHVESKWVPAETRIDEFEFAIRSVCEPIFDKPVKEISLGNLLLRLFQTARRFSMEIQPQLLLLQKTLVSVEGIARDLDPDLDIWEAARPSVDAFMRNRFKFRNIFKGVKEDFPRWTSHLPELPNMTFQALDKIRSGKLVIQTHDPSLESIRVELRLFQKRLISALLGFGLLVVSAILFVSEKFHSELGSMTTPLVILIGVLAMIFIVGSMMGSLKVDS